MSRHTRRDFLKALGQAGTLLAGSATLTARSRRG